MKSLTLNSGDTNRKKSLKISVILHSTILFLALFPFLSISPIMDADEGQMIIAIDFSHSSSSAKNKAPAESGAFPEVKEDKKLNPVEEMEAEKAEETLQKEAEPIVSKTEENEEVITAAEEESEVTDDTLEIKDEKPSEEITEESKESAVSKNSEANGNGNSEDGDESGAGESGDEKEGDFGDNGHGKEGFDDTGEGVFGRKVIKHASLDQIMIKSGRIAVKVCINKLGKVKEVSIIKEETDITDIGILREALNATALYLFESDFEAPALQCGKLTYILDIQKDNSFFSLF